MRAGDQLIQQRAHRVLLAGERRRQLMSGRAHRGEVLRLEERVHPAARHPPRRYAVDAREAEVDEAHAPIRGHDDVARIVRVHDPALVQLRVGRRDSGAEREHRRAIVTSERRRRRRIRSFEPFRDEIGTAFVLSLIEKVRRDLAVEVAEHFDLVAERERRDARDLHRAFGAVAPHAVNLALFHQMHAAPDRPSRRAAAQLDHRPQLALFLRVVGGNEDVVAQEAVEVREQLVEPRLRVLRQLAAVADHRVGDRGRLAKNLQQRRGPPSTICDGTRPCNRESV